MALMRDACSLQLFSSMALFKVCTALKSLSIFASTAQPFCSRHSQPFCRCQEGQELYAHLLPKMVLQLHSYIAHTVSRACELLIARPVP